MSLPFRPSFSITEKSLNLGSRTLGLEQRGRLNINIKNLGSTQVQPKFNPGSARVQPRFNPGSIQVHYYTFYCNDCCYHYCSATTASITATTPPRFELQYPSTQLPLLPLLLLLLLLLLLVFLILLLFQMDRRTTRIKYYYYNHYQYHDKYLFHYHCYCCSVTLLYFLIPFSFPCCSHEKTIILFLNQE